MDFEIVADGLAFPEGPVWMQDGSVIVVEIAAGRITRVEYLLGVALILSIDFALIAFLWTRLEIASGLLLLASIVGLPLVIYLQQLRPDAGRAIMVRWIGNGIDTDAGSLHGAPNVPSSCSGR